MSKDEIYLRLNNVFREVFDDDSLTINEGMTSADVEDWDSLTHIMLITAVEREFGLRFDMKTVLTMENIGEMVSVIDEMTR